MNDLNEADRRLDELFAEVAQMEGTMVSVETAKVLIGRVCDLESRLASTQEQVEKIRSAAKAVIAD